MNPQISTQEPPLNYDPVRVGEVIRRIRNHKDISLLELSVKTAIPQSKLSYIENGKYKKVKIPDIRQIAEALNVGIKELLNPSTESDAPDDGRLEREIETIRSYLLLGRYTEVSEMIRHLEMDINLGNKYYPLLLKVKGDFSRLTGDKQDALRHYEKLEAQAVNAYEKITNKTFLEGIIASICTLYEMDEISTAIRRGQKLLELLNESEHGPLHLERYKAIIYFNLAIFYTESLQYSAAKNMAEKALEYSHTDGIGLDGHIAFLKSIIFFYRSDWTESENCLYEAIHDFRLKDNTRLLTKALLAQHAFILIRPEGYQETLKALENIILGGNELCGETCKHNPLYHQIWNSTIEKCLQVGELERAKELLDSMFNLGHRNSKTTYLLALYYEKMNNQDFVLYWLKKATEQAECDLETSSFDKGMIALEYLKRTVTRESQLIERSQNNFREAGLHNSFQLLKDILPSPID